MLQDILPKNKKICSNKVCHLSSVHPYSDVRIFHKECISLTKANYQVVFVVPHFKDEIREGVLVKSIAGSNHVRITRMTLTVFNVLREALKQDADVYHFHDPELIPVGLLLKFFKKTKVIYDVHENYPSAILSREWLPFWTRRFIGKAFDMLEKISVTFFDAVVCATPSIARRFATTGCTISLIQNFPLLDELHLAKDQKWEDRSNAMVYLGAISELRGIKEMVASAGLIDPETDFKLLLAGNFSPASLKEDIMNIKGWERVEYLGYLSRDEVADLLSQVKAGFVLFHPEPNHVSSQPNKLFEYMSAGIPVIASDFPLWREIVEGNNCGLLVNPQDPIEIADAVTRLLNNTAKSKIMGSNGRNAVVNQYNWSSEQKTLLELYETLLK